MGLIINSQQTPCNTRLMHKGKTAEEIYDDPIFNYKVDDTAPTKTQWEQVLILLIITKLAYLQ